jgi:hypothetical protein
MPRPLLIVISLTQRRGLGPPHGTATDGASPKSCQGPSGRAAWR